ncbi:MAG: non-canonical purine NTP pyrophosphatase [Euryarchaeota archaeon]|nr:non-canonical purine NTP pyrophosphatase [Euryarchaeota archaeon]MBT3653557.1 non-canonical purine NTP pyrophosphatase [Euryarchaeota archaeon]MBT3757661.1 non-canonical purine NTP pyrophosphatase [Euryarchaeota archaeon]MBT4050941.1 non-canonical purine NTP pyrophosphatase [Euryarchaeota archaeon]MBT4346244.1 non-canonical purine NTP pyrophosphatase [Euryarchaeota archaeon]
MRILFATGNLNKIHEAKAILEPLGHTVEGLIIDGNRPEFIEPKELGLEHVAESKIEQALALIVGTEFEGSSILVEDSGIFIDDFDEWPGANSSDIEDELGLDGILKLMVNSELRGAEYRAVAILSNGNDEWKSIGICRGELAMKIRGTNGFGYDPIFIPKSGDGRTYAEMKKGEKDMTSHRAKAMMRLVESLRAPSK